MYQGYWETVSDIEERRWFVPIGPSWTIYWRTSFFYQGPNLEQGEQESKWESGSWSYRYSKYMWFHIHTHKWRTGPTLSYIRILMKTCRRNDGADITALGKHHKHCCSPEWWTDTTMSDQSIMRNRCLHRFKARPLQDSN